MAYPIPEKNFVDIREWVDKLVGSIVGIMNGKTNNTGTITLNTGVTTTVVNEAPNRISTGTVILFMPETANAAAELASGNMYVSARDITARTFTITHSNSANADLEFKYVLVG